MGTKREGHRPADADSTESGDKPLTEAEARKALETTRWLVDHFPEIFEGGDLQKLEAAGGPEDQPIIDLLRKQAEYADKMKVLFSHLIEKEKKN